MSANFAPARRLDGLRLIGLFKWGKALLLLLTLYGANRLLDPAVTDQLYRWSETLTDSESRALVLRFLDWVSGLNARSLNHVAAVTLGYVGLLMVEGTGLWLRLRWAEWLTTIATASLIPFEIWKLLWHTPKNPWLLGFVLALNVLIVIYLWITLHRKAQTA
ncbi:MAG: DUF2127 domain-containing protein [Steroidobacteraceae bacterium]